MISTLDSDSSGLGTKNFLSFQNGARIADSLSMGKVASTLAKGSWIDMGNFRGKYYDNLTHSVWKNINKIPREQFLNLTVSMIQVKWLSLTAHFYGGQLTLQVFF